MPTYETDSEPASEPKTFSEMIMGVHPYWKLAVIGEVLMTLGFSSLTSTSQGFFVCSSILLGAALCVNAIVGACIHHGC